MNTGPTPLDVALRLLECGVSVLPLRLDGSKAPAVSTWDGTSDKRMDVDTAREVFGGNVGIGIIAGRASGNLEIIDIEGRAPVAEIIELIRESSADLLSKLVQVRTPSGGIHLFYRCDTIGRNQKLAMAVIDGAPKTLIETRAQGGYVATISSPPSIHELNKPYELISGKLSEIPTISDFEREIVITCCRSFNTYIRDENRPQQQLSAPTGTGRPGDDYNLRGDPLAVLLSHGWKISHTHGETVYLRRPGKDTVGISATYGHVAPRVLYVFSSNAAPFDMERGYDPFGVYSVLEHGGDVAAAAKTLAGLGYGENKLERIKKDRPKAELIPRENQAQPSHLNTYTLDAKLIDKPDRVSELTDAIKAETVPATVNATARWLEYELVCNGMGALNNINNALKVLESDPVLKDLLWYDEFLQRSFTKKDGDIREWTDVDEINLTLYIQRSLEIHRMGVDVVHQACKSLEQKNIRHCVKDWFAGLPEWDGVERVNHFFADHFGAAESNYTARCSRNFWLSLVARIYLPGCQADNMIVLEGGQGIGKSKALRIIGGAWFTQQHEGITSKAFFEVLQGKLLIEIGEMDAFTRADITRVKDVISAPFDRYREPYERRAVDHLRQCIFVGTTNKDDWNRDDTGARRFWPIACNGMVDTNAIAAAREQLFAEAVAIFKRVPLSATAEERIAAECDWWTTDSTTEAEQRSRLQEDPWQEVVERYINQEWNGSEWTDRLLPIDRLVMLDVLQGPLGIEISRITRSEERRVGSIMTVLKWKKRNIRYGDKVRKVWTSHD